MLGKLNVICTGDSLPVGVYFDRETANEALEEFQNDFEDPEFHIRHVPHQDISWFIRDSLGLTAHQCLIKAIESSQRVALETVAGECVDYDTAIRNSIFYMIGSMDFSMMQAHLLRFILEEKIDE